jgi:septum site-determining protein MinC
LTTNRALNFSPVNITDISIFSMSIPAAGKPNGHSPATFEIKSADLPLVALILKTDDLEQLAIDVAQQFGPAGESPDFFDHDGLVLDFSHFPSDISVQNIVPLLTTLRTCCLVPIAVRGANPEWMSHCLSLGLVETSVEPSRARPVAPIEKVVVEEPLVAFAEPVLPPMALPAMVIDKPLRSGQKVYAKGCDLVVLAMVNQGAEVVADGNIHVYAPLRGKAMAGATGNTHARIFSLCLEPELISIAGIYRTSETPLSPEVQGKPAQVRLSLDGQDKLLFEALNT